MTLHLKRALLLTLMAVVLVVPGVLALALHSFWWLLGYIVAPGCVYFAAEEGCQ